MSECPFEHRGRIGAARPAVAEAFVPAARHEPDEADVLGGTGVDADVVRGVDVGRGARPSMIGVAHSSAWNVIHADAVPEFTGRQRLLLVDTIHQHDRVARDGGGGRAGAASRGSRAWCTPCRRFPSATRTSRGVGGQRERERRGEPG